MEPDYGCWWACDGCRFAGPSLAFYQQVRGLRGPQDAWLELVREAELNPGQHLHMPGAQADHRTAMEQLDVRSQFWKTSSRHLTTRMPMTVELLQEMRLLERTDSGSPTPSKLLGAVERQSLDSLAGQISLRGLEQGFRNGLVLPLESSPGLTCNYLFAGRKSGRTIWASQQVNQQQMEYGLLGLSAIPSTDRVYLVADPLLALTLHSRLLKDTGLYAPVLAFGSLRTRGGLGSTRRAFAAIHHPSVVAWDPDVMLAIAAARMTGERGLVAVRPSGLHPLKGRSAQALFRAWDKAAIPWPQALKSILMNVSPTDSVSLLSYFEAPLTSNERELVKANCTDREWQQVRAVLGNERYSRSFVYDSETFVERPGLGWYRVNQPKPGRPHETCVASAVLVPLTSSCVEDELYYTGEVHYLGQQVPFSVKEKELRKDPAGYITKLCVQREIGNPVFVQQYRKHLLDMALTNRNIETSRALSRVGHDPITGKLVFPKFTIDKGQIHVAPDSALPARTPGANLLPYTQHPRPSALHRWVRLEHDLEPRWALLAAVLANVLAPLHGQPTRGIAVMDGGGQGDQLVTEIGTLLGLQSTRIAKFDPVALELEQIASTERRHGLPLLVRTENPPTGKPWETWARAGPRNCIVVTGIEPVINLSLLDPWVLVKFDSLQEQELAGLECVVAPVLARLTAPEFKPTADWLESIVDGIRMALFEEADIQAGVFFEGVKKHLHDLGRVALHRRFLFALHLELERERLTPGDGGLLRRDEARFVWRLKWDALQKEMLKRWYLPGVKLRSSLEDAGAEVDGEWLEVPEQQWLLAREALNELR